MNLLVIAVQDSEDEVRSALEEAGASLPVLLDSSGRVANDYGVSAIPTTVAVDAAGHVVGTQVGTMTAEQITGLGNGD